MNTFRPLLSIVVISCMFHMTIKTEPKAIPLTKDKVLLGLVRSHTAAFSKENLYKEPLQTQEWYRYLNELKKYVTDNGKGDQKLNSALDTILTHNDTMINSIKVAYNALFATGGSYQEAVAKSATQKLQQVMTEMAAVQKNIAKEMYIYKSKKEVREVLEQAALFIEMTAQKANNDLRKQKPQQKGSEA